MKFTTFQTNEQGKITLYRMNLESGETWILTNGAWIVVTEPTK